MYRKADWAASQVWLGMGVQGSGVQGVPVSIPGEPPFYGVSVKNEIS